MREVAQMGSSSVVPIIIVIAVVLVGLFTASWFRRIERQLKETRKILGELERRLDVVRCRYRDERDQDMQRLKAV